MAKDKVVVALDIGSTKIATIIATIEEAKINIIGAASYPSKGLRKGQVVDIDEAIKSITQSLEAAERMAGYSVGTAFVSVDGTHIESQNSKGVVAISNPEGEITQADINRVIDAASAVSLPPSRVLIHVIPKEFIVDGDSGIKDPLRMEGVRLEAEAHLITASSSAVKNIEKVLDEVGIKVEEFIYSGIASSDAVLTKTEKELGCVMIDIGAGTTSIAVYEEG